jgi:ArsR family transcriptional regulator
VCRTLGHPTRLRIVYLLGQGESTPGELAAAIGVSPANLSQHLAALRATGLAEVMREGVRLRYRLASPEVARACETMRQVLLDRLRRESYLLSLGEGSGFR